MNTETPHPSRVVLVITQRDGTEIECEPVTPATPNTLASWTFPAGVTITPETRYALRSKDQES